MVLCRGDSMVQCRGDRMVQCRGDSMVQFRGDCTSRAPCQCCRDATLLCSCQGTADSPEALRMRSRAWRTTGRKQEDNRETTGGTTGEERGHEGSRGMGEDNTRCRAAHERQHRIACRWRSLSPQLKWQGAAAHCGAQCGSTL